jgi:hypothetical protein
VIELLPMVLLMATVVLLAFLGLIVVIAELEL